MEKEENKNAEGAQRLREIPEWTRKYAQNRSIPFIVGLVINLSLFAAIALPSYFSGRAYLAGDMVLFVICIIILIAAMGALVFFCVPRWGGMFIERVSRRIYGREGNVSIPGPEAMKKKGWIGHLVGLIFGLCVITSVFMGFLNLIPLDYMQPVSALYCVPFLVFLYLWQRPKIGPIALLWPILYGIHAALIVAGVPIFFRVSAQWGFILNVSLPFGVYGILPLIIGHFYSRYALKKLKGLAHVEGEAGDGT